MKSRNRRSRAVGWCWLIGGLTLTGCVGPKHAGPFGVVYALDTQRIHVHTVAQGETLYGLARRYGMSATSLADYNDISEPGRLRIGQTLRVPLPVTVPLAVAARSLAAAVQPNDGTLPPAAPQKPPSPATLTSPVPASVALVPLKPHPAGPAKLADALRPGPLPRKSPPGKLVLQWPVTGTVTSHFGRRKGRAHDGIDIGAPMGTQVRAAADGDVVFADTHRGYGNVVILRHADGVMTIYAHHQKNLVLAGQRVRQGDPIAQVGSTGRASGPHLHFEVRQRAQPHDPLRFLPRSAS